MTAREFDQWMIFNSLEPIGGMRADVNAGIIAATIANAHRDPKTTSPFVPADFMLFTDRDEQSLDDLSMKFQAASGYVDESEELPEGVNRFGYSDD